MKTTNQFLRALITFVVIFSSSFSSSFAQDEPEERPLYITATTMHWNMDLEDFDMDEWKAVEKEYLEKVTMKNELIMGASFYMHRFTADNTELLYVQAYASWGEISKAGERNSQLEKEAWPDETARKAFLEKRDSYYSNVHSDEIYATMSGTKLMSEAPTKDMICYVRKGHFAFPEDGSQDEFSELRLEANAKIFQKNELIKAYYPNTHAWGSDRTEFVEAFFLDSMTDLDNMFNRNQELAKEAWPDESARKARGKKMGKYFTGVHGDYIYTFIAGLSK